MLAVNCVVLQPFLSFFAFVFFNSESQNNKAKQKGMRCQNNCSNINAAVSINKVMTRKLRGEGKQVMKHTKKKTLKEKHLR